MSAFMVGGVMAVAGLTAAFVAAPMPSIHAQLSREVPPDAIPVICQADGMLTLSGLLNGRAGTWWVPGDCIQTGSQEPLCLPFIAYGEDDGPCVLAEMPIKEGQ
jgi:hypothetical protein